MNEKKLNALVVEGGGMRGIFSTGVLDAFIKEKFNPFDICLGVSAGSTNLTSFLAGMYQRNYKIYTDYSIRPDFINFKKFIKGGSLMDLDWLWDITLKDSKVDLNKIFESNTKLYVVLTNADTGKAVYLTPDKDNIMDMLKASSSLPVIYRKCVKIEDVEYVDGGVADSIPVEEAYKMNASNIMVIRSRPKTYTMKSNRSDYLLCRHYLKEYTNLLKTIKRRPIVYQKSIDFMRKPPKGVNIIEVNPPETFKTKRMTKDIEILNHDYKSGYDAGIAAIKRWKEKTML